MVAPLAASVSGAVTESTEYRSTRAATLKCIAIEVGPKSAVPGVIRPIVRVRFVTRARAAGDGL